MTALEIAKIVEAGGGILVGIQAGCGLVGGDIVLFQYVKGGTTCALYASALTVHNVELAIKAKREEMATSRVPA